MSIKYGLFYKLGFLYLLFFYEEVYSQSIPVSYPVIEEAIRRKQLLGELDQEISFGLRPLHASSLSAQAQIDGLLPFFYFLHHKERADDGKFTKALALLPIRNTFTYNSGRPYGWGNGLMIPNVGFQNYSSLGVFGKIGPLKVQLQPEFVTAENLSFSGFPSDFPPSVTRSRFFYWNNGDFPERFGNGTFNRFWWGQSKVSLTAGSFELGISTENIWWGPGQFNSLTFSNNAQGFPHLSLNSTKPIKTFLGSLEGQMIIGRLEDSQLEPTQHEALNQLYFNPFSGDWKYLNALNLIYQPKWVSHLFIGFSRTYQQYDGFRENRFKDWFPILDPFQKSEVGFDRDLEGKDQQVAVSLRYLIPSAGAEIYGEYGRRDHALNWREFILNPDHARAYLLGFNKLFEIPGEEKYIQVRAEMTQQQESVNRYIRYLGLGGNQTWHTHWRARGFTNHGQALGVGTGVGSNVQSAEIAMVKKLNKFGVLMERVANHQDFYFRAFGQQQERKPWVDLSLGLLFDYQMNNLLVSSRFQVIHGLNYQWQLSKNSTSLFPVGSHRYDFMGQIHLLYLWNQR